MRFLFNSARRQQIDVTALMGIVLEIIHLYQTLLNQGIDTVIHFPKTDSQLFGQFSLADAGRQLQGL